jgi:ferredoxin-NADP reductase
MLLTATIETVTPATPRSLLVRIALDRELPFVAGQAALVGARGLERRPYSIAIGPEDSARTRTLEFLMGHNGDGIPGPHLPRPAAGLPVEIEGPAGKFTFPAAPREHHFLFVAGGSGIAPLRSMVHHALSADRRWRLALVYSARVPEELAFDAELRQLALNSRLHYYPTTTRETGEAWSGGRGRIDQALLEMCIKDPATLCFVCGPESLVHEVPRLLVGLGVAESRIRIEEWTAESAK